jgi:hypothetical protein
MCCRKHRQQFPGSPNLPFRPATTAIPGNPRPGYAAPRVGPAPAAAPPRGVAAVAAQASAAGPVFEYVGRTALSVASPITGNRYRFDHAGARLNVDPRDSRWLLSVPNLTLIAGR